MQVFLHGLDGFFCVGRGSSANQNSLQTLVFEHGQVITVYSNSVWLPIELSPKAFSFVWRKDSDELRAGSAVEQVEGMAFTHSAQPSTGNLQLLRSHCNIEVNECDEGRRNGSVCQEQ